MCGASRNEGLGMDEQLVLPSSQLSCLWRLMVSSVSSTAFLLQDGLCSASPECLSLGNFCCRCEESLHHHLECSSKSEPSTQRSAAVKSASQCNPTHQTLLPLDSYGYYLHPHNHILDTTLFSIKTFSQKLSHRFHQSLG